MLTEIAEKPAKIHPVVTCLLVQRIILLLGLYAKLWHDSARVPRAHLVSNKAGGFAYEHSQRENTST